MKVIHIQPLRGPNYWSNSHRYLIQLRLDTEGLGKLEMSLAAELNDKLSYLFHSFENLIPWSAFSPNTEPESGIDDFVGKVALYIQVLAGMNPSFGRVKKTKFENISVVVFEYEEEEVGRYAARAAVGLLQSFLENTGYDLTQDIKKMRSLREDVRFGPSTGSIVEEAVSRGIPFIRVNTESLVQLGYGKNQVRFRATMTENTSSIAVDIAKNKTETKRLLEEASIAVAKGFTVLNKSELADVVRKVGFPLVVKPADGNHGKGVSIDLKNLEDVEIAFDHAKDYSRKIIIESFIEGYDFRILVINHKFVAAALREPACIIGDGVQTIKELIENENKDPRRGYGHENVLTEISINSDTLNQLAKHGLTLESILSKGEKLYVKGTANLSTGGTSEDVTDTVHPNNIFTFERISRIIGLDICGIDIMGKNLSIPIEESGAAVLEVNASPGFRMHLAPAKGLPRNVAAPVIDMLYPSGKQWHIPIIAITGSNGKTTTTRLIAHIAKNQGYRVGFTTSDGIYVHNSMLTKGDTTGPMSAEAILKDPSVEFAVLETARGGILRAGLGFRHCDLAVVTNIQEDHLGISDIDTLEDLAKVKSVVVKSVKPDGYAVLNADNPYTVKMAKNAKCKVAFFSLDENNPVIVKHCKKGGIAAICENGYISIKKGEWKFRVERVNSVPITFGGRITFMVQNVLAATLAGYLYGFATEEIAKSLETFIPSPTQTPGRLNIYEFQNFRVMVDFAHNLDAFKGIKEFLATINSPQKIGIIIGTGDRRDEDLRDLGRISAEIFDHIIINQDKFLRGRKASEIVDLLTEGIKSHNPEHSFEFLPTGIEPLKHAMKMAVPGAFIAALSDVLVNPGELIQGYLEEERSWEL
jgi:cyanophycin synthetase